jgi:hypothetical protein
MRWPPAVCGLCWRELLIEPPCACPSCGAELTAVQPVAIQVGIQPHVPVTAVPDATGFPT